MSVFPTGLNNDDANDSYSPALGKPRFITDKTKEGPPNAVGLAYDKEKNTVYIGAPESAFVPKYLDYLLEYLKLPKDVKREFKKEK